MNECDAASTSDTPPLGYTREAEQVDGVKARLVQLCARDDELSAVIERVMSEREAVRAKMASVKDELDTLVNTPVSGGRDPTLWLPDELMEMIFLMEPCELLWDGVCEQVCQRWARIVRESTLVKRRKQEERRVAYETGIIRPDVLGGHTDVVWSLAVGLDGKIYSGSEDKTIRVWSGVDGIHLQTLEGHSGRVLALAVGLDGRIYSGSHDKTIRAWSGVDGTHLQTLEGHTNDVCALAVGLDGKIYSGSHDKTIRVWSGVDGTHLQTLEGHTNHVYTVAVGLDGKIYSGSRDKTIRVWSGVDGAHMQTLEGHGTPVYALAVGLDGNVYSSSGVHEIQVWSGVDGTHLQTLEGQTDYVMTLAVGLDGKIYSGACGTQCSILVWSGKDGNLLHLLDTHHQPHALAVTRDGKLLSGMGKMMYYADDQSADEYSEDAKVHYNLSPVLMW